MINNKYILDHLNNIAEILLVENALIFDSKEMAFKIKTKVEQLDNYLKNINNDEYLLSPFKEYMQCSDTEKHKYILKYKFEFFKDDAYPSLLLYLSADNSANDKKEEFSGNIIVLYSNCILNEEDDIYKVNEYFVNLNKEKEFHEKYENNLFLIKNESESSNIVS